MAAFPRVTMFFEDGEFGWTETHYLTPPSDLDTLLLEGSFLASLRVNLNGSNPVLNWLRLSLDDTKTDAQIVGPLGFVHPHNKDGKSDVPWSTVLLRMESTSLYRSQLYLSGIPDSMIVNPPGPTPSPAWNRSFARWKKELCSGKWGFKALSKDDSVAPQFAITGLSVNFNEITVQLPRHNFNVGDTVHLSYIRGGSGTPPNGDWIVTDLTANEVSLKGNTVPYLWRRGGYAKKVVYQFVPYTDVLIMGETSHARGKKFRPVSWDIPGKPNFAFQPCGGIVDLLRSCYLSPVQFGTTPDTIIGRRWFFARKTAVPVPYNLFGSSVWFDDRAKLVGPGEIQLPRIWDSGANIGALAGRCNISETQFWTTGLTVQQSTLFVAQPPCCQPLVPARGIALGGKARQQYTPPPPLRFGMALASKAKQGKSTAKLPALGVALAGTGRQVLGEAKIPNLGIALGGKGQQLLGSGSGSGSGSGGGSGSGSGHGDPCCNTLNTSLCIVVYASLNTGDGFTVGQVVPLVWTEDCQAANTSYDGCWLSDSYRSSVGEIQLAFYCGQCVDGAIGFCYWLEARVNASLTHEHQLSPGSYSCNPLVADFGLTINGLSMKVVQCNS